MGGCVGPGTGLDDVEKKNFCPDRESNFDPSADQSISRRNYTQTEKLMKNSVFWTVALTLKNRVNFMLVFRPVLHQRY
jgi:hypothetical protein